jgi:hypothetical protein
VVPLAEGDDNRLPAVRRPDRCRVEGQGIIWLDWVLAEAEHDGVELFALHIAHGTANVRFLTVTIGLLCASGRLSLPHFVTPECLNNRDDSQTRVTCRVTAATTEWSKGVHLRGRGTR